MKCQWHHKLMTWYNHQIFFDGVFFLLSSLVTGPSFMSISSLVLEFWQFSFTRDWPEIRKSEISTSEFSQYLETGASQRCQIWHKCFLWNVTECCKMPDARVTAFTVLELLMRNQQGRGGRGEGEGGGRGKGRGREGEGGEGER